MSIYSSEIKYYNDILSIKKHMRKNLRAEIKIRDKFGFEEEYFYWLLSGRKTTTIRYAGKNAIDLPNNNILPVGIKLKESGIFVHLGRVLIRNIEIKTFSELDNYDAIRDGFKDAEDMRQELRRLYHSGISDDDYVTIYSLYLLRYHRPSILSIGVNVGKTSYGKLLKDGGTTIIENGNVLISLAEERITRKKHDGGFENSLSLSLDRLNINISDIDILVTSSCVDFRDIRYSLPGDGYLRTLRISHHLSHAYSAFMLSPFDEAIIIVMDAGGDILEDKDEKRKNEWWRYRREQVSCYVGRGEYIELLCRFFDNPLDIGFGEMYRAFTYYLGWNSYTYSANTMALAAYGDPNRFSGDIFPFADGYFKGFPKFEGENTNESVTPNHPEYIIKELGSKYGLRFPPKRGGNSQQSPIGQDYMDMAAYVQSELEKSIINLVSWLIKKTNIRNVCLAGGVALNCVANTKILEHTEAKGLFVVPAAGDTGQSMGNALFGHFFMGGTREDIFPFNPYLGFSYSDNEIREALLEYGLTFKKLDKKDYIRFIAQQLKKGKIVGWFYGRSEFGPRALGHRSILADPRNANLEGRLRRLKGREHFRPFSPSILEEHMHSYFDLPYRNSPYMLLVGYARPKTKELVPLVVHVDGTSRLQTVSREDGMFYELIQEFYRITNVPILLNTSFNRRDEPIVETPKDAIDIFLDKDVGDALDILAIDGYVVERGGE